MTIRSGPFNPATALERGRNLTEQNFCELPDFYGLPAMQQPDWHDDPRLPTIRQALSESSPLIVPDHITTLRLLLADVAGGRMKIIQAGDCAEDPAEHTPRHLSRKLGLIQALADIMRGNTGLPVLCVGRIAGQFAKPRSASHETVRGLVLPAFRGPLVNRPNAELTARQHDPSLLLECYGAAATMMSFLNGSGEWGVSPLLWTSHEALVLDYELPQLCRFDDQVMLTSTHWPWMGERTRQPDGAHTALLASIANPVATKVGPDATADDLLNLCERLDPRREPGRLTLVSRMGTAITEKLPPLVTAAREAGYPVIWLCDPMHGNTVRLSGSLKTRFVEAIRQEIQEFQRIVTGLGGVAGGLHLETTPDQVTECGTDRTRTDQVGETYTTLCDPRLNCRQALSMAAEWTAR